jgi:hypothetical protein
MKILNQQIFNEWYNKIKNTKKNKIAGEIF